MGTRQQKLAQMLSKLIKMAEEFNVAIFITNQVVSDPGGGAMFVSDPKVTTKLAPFRTHLTTKKPVGGHILAHASTTRLSLRYFFNLCSHRADKNNRKGRGDQRIAKIFDSPCLPEAESVFQIGDSGIQDAAE